MTDFSSTTNLFAVLGQTPGIFWKNHKFIDSVAAFRSFGLEFEI
jgi:hypothetical protein